MRVAPEIKLTRQERTALTQWSRGRTVSVRQAERAQMLPLAAEGDSDQEIAAKLHVKPPRSVDGAAGLRRSV